MGGAIDGVRDKERSLAVSQASFQSQPNYTYSRIIFPSTIQDPASAIYPCTKYLPTYLLYKRY